MLGVKSGSKGAGPEIKSISFLERGMSVRLCTGLFFAVLFSFTVGLVILIGPEYCG